MKVLVHISVLQFSRQAKKIKTNKKLTEIEPKEKPNKKKNNNNNNKNAVLD